MDPKWSPLAKKTNGPLFASRAAPGEAASSARFSNKKQLFEQQLTDCRKSELGSGMLQTNEGVAENMNWKH